MVSVQLNDAAAAALVARAAAEGLSLEAYLEQIALAGPKLRTPDLSADEFLKLLEEESLDGPSPTGSFSRAELYRDHD